MSKSLLQTLQEKILEKYDDVKKFAAESGISYGTIMNIGQKDKMPSLPTFISICKKLNLDANEILGLYDAQINSQKIPILDVKASAGYGYQNLDNPPIIGYFDLQKHIDLKCPKGFRPAIFEVTGNSMKPLLNDGDYVFCALGCKMSHGIYVVNIEGNVLVKTLQFKAGKIIIKSENKTYEDEIIDEKFNGYFNIIGYVFYHCKNINI